MEYRVTWMIDIIADNEVEAAKKAQEIMINDRLDWTYEVNSVPKRVALDEV
jgi:hypothetical protein